MTYKGLSVLFRTNEEYNKLKEFLGEDVLYIDFLPVMVSNETAVVIHYNGKDFSTGSVGSVNYQRSQKIRVVQFSEYFKL